MIISASSREHNPRLNFLAGIIGAGTMAPAIERFLPPNVPVFSATQPDALASLVAATREGIVVMQIMPSMLMYVNVFSKEPGVDQTFLYNFAQVNVLQVIRRVRGIGSPRFSRSVAPAYSLRCSPRR